MSCTCRNGCDICDRKPAINADAVVLTSAYRNAYTRQEQLGDNVMAIIYKDRMEFWSKVAEVKIN